MAAQLKVSNLKVAFGTKSYKYSAQVHFANKLLATAADGSTAVQVDANTTKTVDYRVPPPEDHLPIQQNDSVAAKFLLNNTKMKPGANETKKYDKSIDIPLGSTNKAFTLQFGKIGKVTFDATTPAKQDAAKQQEEIKEAKRQAAAAEAARKEEEARAAAAARAAQNDPNFIAKQHAKAREEIENEESNTRSTDLLGREGFEWGLLSNELVTMGEMWRRTDLVNQREKERWIELVNSEREAYKDLFLYPELRVAKPIRHDPNLDVMKERALAALAAAEEEAAAGSALGSAETGSKITSQVVSARTMRELQKLTAQERAILAQQLLEEHQQEHKKEQEQESAARKRGDRSQKASPFSSPSSASLQYAKHADTTTVTSSGLPRFTNYSQPWQTAVEAAHTTTTTVIHSSPPPPAAILPTTPKANNDDGDVDDFATPPASPSPAVTRTATAVNANSAATAAAGGGGGGTAVEGSPNINNNDESNKENSPSPQSLHTTKPPQGGEEEGGGGAARTTTTFVLSPGGIPSAKIPPPVVRDENDMSVILEKQAREAVLEQARRQQVGWSDSEDSDDDDFAYKQERNPLRPVNAAYRVATQQSPLAGLNLLVAPDGTISSASSSGNNNNRRVHFNAAAKSSSVSPNTNNQRSLSPTQFEYSLEPGSLIGRMRTKDRSKSPKSFQQLSLQAGMTWSVLRAAGKFKAKLKNTKKKSLYGLSEQERQARLEIDLEPAPPLMTALFTLNKGRQVVSPNRQQQQQQQQNSASNTSSSSSSSSPTFSSSPFYSSSSSSSPQPHIQHHLSLDRSRQVPLVYGGKEPENAVEVVSQTERAEKRASPPKLRPTLVKARLPRDTHSIISPRTGHQQEEQESSSDAQKLGRQEHEAGNSYWSCFAPQKAQALVGVRVPNAAAAFFEDHAAHQIQSVSPPKRVVTSPSSLAPVSMRTSSPPRYSLHKLTSKPMFPTASSSSGDGGGGSFSVASPLRQEEILGDVHKMISDLKDASNHNSFTQASNTPVTINNNNSVPNLRAL